MLARRRGVPKKIWKDVVAGMRASIRDVTSTADMCLPEGGGGAA